MSTLRWGKPLMLTGTIMVYALLFYHYDTAEQKQARPLSPALPEIIYQASLGFLKQIGAETLFIKSKVHFGGLEPSAPIDNPYTYAEYFRIVSVLHPEFSDTYHFSESILPWEGEEPTKLNNKIIIRGTKAHPDYFMFPFYLGFNHFYFLKNYKKAATYFWEASQKKDAPNWMGHLAAILSARGGDIMGGLVLLRAMEQSETDESVKYRYQRDIIEYEKAAMVQKALNAYASKHQSYPAKLSELIPEFIPSLPTFNGKYRLSYAPPELRMVRDDEHRD